MRRLDFVKSLLVAPLALTPIAGLLAAKPESLPVSVDPVDFCLTFRFKESLRYAAKTSSECTRDNHVKFCWMFFKRLAELNSADVLQVDVHIDTWHEQYCVVDRLDLSTKIPADVFVTCRANLSRYRNVMLDDSSLIEMFCRYWIFGDIVLSSCAANFDLVKGAGLLPRVSRMS